MLQAMNTGHDGSMTTVHADTPRDAISRLEQMIGMASYADDNCQHPPSDHHRHPDHPAAYTRLSDGNHHAVHSGCAFSLQSLRDSLLRQTPSATFPASSRPSMFCQLSARFMAFFSVSLQRFREQSTCSVPGAHTLDECDAVHLQELVLGQDLKLFVSVTTLSSSRSRAQAFEYALVPQWRPR